MSPSVSGALPFTSKSKKKYEIMDSKIMTKYQVEGQHMSAKYTLLVTYNMIVLIWVIAWERLLVINCTAVVSLHG